MIQYSQKLVEAVKKSKLTEEEKNRALRPGKKAIITTRLLVLFVFLMMGIGMIYGISKGTEGGIWFSLTSLIGGVVVIIMYVLFAHKLFPDWTKYSNLVEKGYDGLASVEMEALKPTASEKAMIKACKRKSVVAGILFLTALAIVFSIILKLGIAIYSPITIIITLIITIIWWVKEDTYQVEIHRIESGYYKRDLGYICTCCREEVKIGFNEMEKYNSLPKNKNGIREMRCPKCNNPILLYDFDSELKDYKNICGKEDRQRYK